MASPSTANEISAMVSEQINDMLDSVTKSVAKTGFDVDNENTYRQGDFGGIINNEIEANNDVKSVDECNCIDDDDHKSFKPIVTDIGVPSVCIVGKEEGLDEEKLDNEGKNTHDVFENKLADLFSILEKQTPKITHVDIFYTSDKVDLRFFLPNQGDSKQVATGFLHSDDTCDGGKDDHLLQQAPFFKYSVTLDDGDFDMEAEVDKIVEMYEQAIIEDIYEVPRIPVTSPFWTTEKLLTTSIVCFAFVANIPRILQWWNLYT